MQRTVFIQTSLLYFHLHQNEITNQPQVFQAKSMAVLQDSMLYYGMN